MLRRSNRNPESIMRRQERDQQRHLAGDELAFGRRRNQQADASATSR